MQILLPSVLPLSTNEDSLKLGNPTQSNHNFSKWKLCLRLLNSTKCYLEICYNNIPKKTVIWVANRESALPKNSLATFRLVENRNFVLTNERKIVIWSSNVSVAMLNLNSSYRALSDTGNLELRHGSKSSVVWQNFEHPTDTLMPEMKLGLNRKTGRQDLIISWADDDDDPRPMFSMGQDPKGLPQFYIWKKEQIY